VRDIGLIQWNDTYTSQISTLKNARPDLGVSVYSNLPQVETIHSLFIVDLDITRANKKASLAEYFGVVERLTNKYGDEFEQERLPFQGRNFVSFARAVAVIVPSMDDLRYPIIEAGLGSEDDMRRNKFALSRIRVCIRKYRIYLKNSQL